MRPLDAAWIATHPLPEVSDDADKNTRGRVLLVGGSRHTPGSLRLAGEAALRSGAGKLQIATVANVAAQLGLLVPEAAVIPLPMERDGEIGRAAIEVLENATTRCDTLILGPGMRGSAKVTELIEALCATPRPGLSLVLDAGAIVACGALEKLLLTHAERVILTPHHGEMAALTGHPIESVDETPREHAQDVAKRFGAVVVLKSPRTLVAAPDGAMLAYEGGGAGLATGGSGDVLAGIAGGLLARGADPVRAAAWSVWLHGEAGRRVAARIGPIGFLARDLMVEIPRLIARG